jgi:hypothetical protein
MGKQLLYDKQVNPIAHQSRVKMVPQTMEPEPRRQVRRLPYPLPGAAKIGSLLTVFTGEHKGRFNVQAFMLTGIFSVLPLLGPLRVMIPRSKSTSSPLQFEKLVPPQAGE